LKNNDNALELYKVTVEMADRLSARRGVANTFFITLESALSAALGVWIGNGEDLSMRKAMALVAVSAMISILWWIQITSYRNISTAKFAVIHEIEKELSFAPYTREWALIKVEQKRHVDLTKSERFVPFIFLAIDLFLIFTALS
jgi:hypothetical protein